MMTLDCPREAPTSPRSSFWVGQPVLPCATSLAHMVGRAVANLEQAVAGQPHCPGATLSSRGWALVFRMTYAYCLGICSSVDVAELACVADPLSRASDPGPPDAAELRRLRRGCRPLVCQCLAMVLTQIARLRLAYGAEAPWNTPPRAAWLFAPCFDCASGQEEHQEAEARLRWAARLDSMEMDE